MTNSEAEWQLGCSKLSDRGAHLLKTGLWSDCSFLVRDAVTVKSHKFMLAMASPVFAAMFHSGVSDSFDLIPIIDIKPEVFDALLKYIYTDKLDDESFDLVFDLYYAAHKYMLPSLVKECSTYMTLHLSAENACRVYELARLFGDIVLMDDCLKVISSKTKEVLNDSSFLEIDVKTLETVFSLEYMKIDSEIDLLEASVRYLKALEERTKENSTAVESISNVEDHVDKESAPQSTSNISTRNTMDTKVTTVRDAIKQIRFLTLNPHQLANINSKLTRPGMLTDLECYALLMNILTCLSSSVAMPDGFSTNRMSRNRDPVEHLRVYCSRAWLPSNTHYGDKYCYLNFAADHDFVLQGVQVPSQFKWNDSSTYTEDISLRLWSATDPNDDNFIINFDFDKVVSYNTVMDINFPNACTLVKNQVYVILIQFFARGKYPKGVCKTGFTGGVDLSPVTIRVVDVKDNENQDLLRAFVIQRPTHLIKHFGAT